MRKAAASARLSKRMPSERVIKANALLAGWHNFLIKSREESGAGEESA